MQASKADQKHFFSRNVLRKDEYGNEKVIAALFVNRSFYDRIVKYQKLSDKVFIESEALRRRRRDEHAKSKAIAKDWPDSVENIEKAKKLREHGEAARLKKETEEKDKQIAWENRSTDRKILVDAKEMQWNELPEVREIHRAYLKAQVLNEINAQKEFNKILKERKKAEKIKDEGAKSFIHRIHEKEVKQEAERAMQNKIYWEFINRQVEERMKLRETYKKEKMKEELEILNMIKDESNELLEEKTRRANRMNFIKGLEVSRKENELLKVERLQDDEELEKSIQAYHDNIDKYKKVIMEMSEDHLIPGAKARKMVMNQAQNIWETNVKTQIKKENELFEKQRRELIARETERIEAEKRKKSEQKIAFKLANDNLIKQKLQKKLLSQKMKNLDRIQKIKLFEKEKERKQNQEDEIKAQKQLIRLNNVQQEAAKAIEKKLYLKEIDDFVNEKNISQEKLKEEFTEYKKKLSRELKSENKDSRPVDEVIQLIEKQHRRLL